jgi:hypothetical protein
MVMELAAAYDLLLASGHALRLQCSHTLFVNPGMQMPATIGIMSLRTS